MKENLLKIICFILTYGIIGSVLILLFNCGYQWVSLLATFFTVIVSVRFMANKNNDDEDCGCDDEGGK